MNQLSVEYCVSPNTAWLLILLLLWLVWGGLGWNRRDKMLHTGDIESPECVYSFTFTFKKKCNILPIVFINGLEILTLK